MVYKRKDLPKKGEIILAKVKKVIPHSFFAWLEEYENLEAIVHVSEISSSWVKNIKNYVKEGEMVVLKVIDIKGKQIVASLKRVSSGEKKRIMQEWKLNSKIEKLIGVYAQSKKLSTEVVYRDLGDEIIKVFGSFYNFYESIKEYGDEVLNELKSKYKKEFFELVKSQLKDKDVSVKVSIKVSSNEGDGLTKIKKLFSKVCKKAKIVVISAPKYSIEITAKSYKEGTKEIQDLLNTIKLESDKLGIDFEEEE